MRLIRIGDTVEAFLDARIKGTVMEITGQDGPWMAGGTAGPEMFCVLELEDGRRLKIKMSELHHVHT